MTEVERGLKLYFPLLKKIQGRVLNRPELD